MKILSTVWTAVKVLASSRKFQAAILSAVSWIIGRFGFHADATDLLPIVGPLWGYIFGVAIEDAGKAKATIQAASNAALLDSTRAITDKLVA